MANTQRHVKEAGALFSHLTSGPQLDPPGNRHIELSLFRCYRCRYDDAYIRHYHSELGYEDQPRVLRTCVPVHDVPGVLTRRAVPLESPLQ